MSTPPTSITTADQAGSGLGVLTIRHSYEGGTIVVGTTKDSPAHHALGANPSWTWSGYARTWLLRSSRHRSPKYGDIALIERALTGLGYRVTREIDPAMPSVEQQEADLAERMEDRAAALTIRAGAWADKSASSSAAADAVFDRIPFGQPEMPDHHSHAADHNRRARGRAARRRSYEQSDRSAELSRRADVAADHMRSRYSPVTVGNRIEKLEADRRRVQRWLDGEGALETHTDEHDNLLEESVTRPPEGEARDRWIAEVAKLDEQIAYWKDIYAQLQADGKASTAGPDTVAKGDWVLVRGQWYRVRRVNKKTVSLPDHIVKTPQPGEHEYTNTTPWHEVRDYRTTQQMPSAFVTAYEEPGRERFRLKLTDFESSTA